MTRLIGKERHHSSGWRNRRYRWLALCNPFCTGSNLAGSVIIPTLDELSGVEVGAAIAFIVDSLTIEHQWTAHSVDIWQAIKGHHVSNDGAHHIRDRRAARYFDNGFVGDDFVDRRCLRRIGRAACTQPQDAQVPQVIIALAPAAARLSFSINGRPLLIQNIPCSPSGGLPSTARIYLPLYCAMMSSKTSSAWAPAAAIKVSS